MSDREELAALRRLAELEDKAAGVTQPSAPIEPSAPTLGQRFAAMRPETELLAEGAKGVARGVLSIGDIIQMGLQQMTPFGKLIPRVEQPSVLREAIAPSYSGSVTDPSGAQFMGTAGELLGAGLPFGAFQPVPALLGAIGEQMAGEPGKLAGVVAPSIGTAMRPLADEAVKRAMRGPSAQAFQQSVNTLQQAGIQQPTVGIASGKFTPQAIESTVSKVPGGAGLMRAKGQEMAEGMGQRVDDIASQLSAAREKFQAGRAISLGVDDFVDKLRTRWGQLNAPVDAALRGKTGAASNFMQALKTSGEPIKGAEDISLMLGARDPKLANAYQAMLNPQPQTAGGITYTPKPGMLSYDAMRELRSAIGEKISSPQLIDDISRKHYKALYGALSEDIREMAKAAGSDVLKSFDYSNAVFKHGVSRIENILGGIGSKATWEQAYNAAVSGAKDGPSKIWALRRSIGDDNFKDFQAVVIRGLGKEQASAGQGLQEGFAINSFLTNYRKLDGKTRDALFGLSGSLRHDMDTVAQAAGKVREGAKVFYNPSGTAGATGAIATGASIPTALAFMLGGNVGVGLSLLGGAAGMSVGANQGAKLMTNPKFISWLAQSTKIPYQKLGGHAARLISLSDGESDEGSADAMRAIGQSLIGPRRIYSEQPGR